MSQLQMLQVRFLAVALAEYGQHGGSAVGEGSPAARRSACCWLGRPARRCWKPLWPSTWPSRPKSWPSGRRARLATDPTLNPYPTSMHKARSQEYPTCGVAEGHMAEHQAISVGGAPVFGVNAQGRYRESCESSCSLRRSCWPLWPTS